MKESRSQVSVTQGSDVVHGDVSDFLAATGKWMEECSMARRSGPAKPSGPISGVAQEILIALKTEFIEQSRSAADLSKGYVGLNMQQLQTEVLGSEAVSRVDYDLALKELEDRKLVGTGPMEMYDNPPNSSAIIIAFFSKREYIYLKEEGYRMAGNQLKAKSSQPKQNVHISGGNFYQSPIGVGEQVSQQINFDVSNEADSARYLAELLGQAGKSVDESTRADLVKMVSAANKGDMAAAKPVFRKVFGMVAEPVKQLAYGVLTAIVMKQMGM
ncbi:hypothetical protein [Novosphingopyxis sp.]|uniref:hypothetical protein n=1 Tax=Novosphingopyxis sp. TaxID=2709690 RepID=UPI003B5B4D2E